MELFPAIDLQNAAVVRLTQGDFDKMEVYSNDPVAMAATFMEQGARNLHVVDLDGARDGTTANFSTIHKLAQQGGLFMQVGGGIRDEARISRYLELGVDRVILGTVAVEDFDFLTRMVQKYGDKIAVGVDAKDRKVAVRGWKDITQVDSFSFCKRLDQAGVATIIYTDIARDGAMKGTNIAAYETLSAQVGCSIVASGGISQKEELQTLSEMGLYGAILGKSLYTGAINLQEVVTLC